MKNTIHILRPMFHLPLLLFAMLILTGSACAQKEKVETNNGTLHIQVVAEGLNHPWAMEFLPDGRMLITERSGDLRILNTDSTLSQPLTGVPDVVAKGQGGLLDVALHPDFENNKWVYLSYSEPGANNTASTALGRAKLVNNGLESFEVIFRQEPKVDGNNHFGNRIIFHDGFLYLAMGERFKFDPAQDLSSHLGKIIRINYDGSVPDDNPFVNEENAKAEIWTYGNRNIQAAAIDPTTGNFWVAEFGPKGGDELNLIVKGENYGWPEVSNGNHYDGGDIPDHSTRPEFTKPVITWNPVISPSGMKFYTGEMFPEWKGKMLIGGLSSNALVIVQVDGKKAMETDRLDMDARIRDVAIAEDGSVYLITDHSNGKVLRLYQ